MAISTSIISATSIGPINTPINAFSSPTAFRSPVPPQSRINPIDAQAASSSLQYPSDRPKYYITFDFYEYHRDSLLTVGQLGSSLGQVVMPLSAQLVDTLSVKWEDVPLGQLTGGAINALMPQLQGIVSGEGSFAEKAAAAAGAAAAGATNTDGVTGGDVGSVIGSNITPAQAIWGISPNQFVTLLFVGPQYKVHQFQWLCSPHNKNESDSLRKIINAFKNAESPSLTAGGLVWKFPRIVKVAFYPNSKFLYKFKPMIIRSFQATYTPTGRAAFYKGSENPPESIMIAIQLEEIEFWLTGQFDDSPDPFATGSQG